MDPLANWTEAQVWGPIDFSDIEEFLVYPSVNDETLKLLKKTGLRISLMSGEMDHGRLVNAYKAQPIYAGDPNGTFAHRKSSTRRGANHLMPCSSF